MKPRGSGEGDYDLSPTRQYTVVSKMPKGRRKNAALFLANSCFISSFFSMIHRPSIRHRYRIEFFLFVLFLYDKLSCVRTVFWGSSAPDPWHFGTDKYLWLMELDHKPIFLRA